MTDEQPEALRLADDLDAEFVQGRISNHSGRKAAVMLRRLHAENEALRQSLRIEELISFRRQMQTYAAQVEADTALLRQALEALESCTPGDYSTGHVISPSYDESNVEAAITAIKDALAEQPAQQQDIDWKDQYEKQKRRAEMWVAKYEADIGPLEKAGPVTAQQQEPVAWRYHGKLHEFDPSDWATGPVTPLYTSPPAKPWVNPSLKEYEDIMLANITPRTEDERDGIMCALNDMVVLLKEKNQ